MRGSSMNVDMKPVFELIEILFMTYNKQYMELNLDNDSRSGVRCFNGIRV